MELGLSGKAALVSASSKGLGLACATALAAEGADVVMCARDENGLTAAAEEVRKTARGRVVSIAADISREEDVARLFGVAAAEVGEIDVLVTNAGGPPPVPLDDITDQHWHDAFVTTHMSATRMIRAVLPGMRKKGWGRIVAIGSSSVKQPVGSLHLSNGIRPGLAGFLKSLADDLAKAGITVNSVLPGVFLTNRITTNRPKLSGASGSTCQEHPDGPVRRDTGTRGISYVFG
jgi:3-oxoacyl-[acyl-carrier protein] reductase